MQFDRALPLRIFVCLLTVTVVWGRPLATAPVSAQAALAAGGFLDTTTSTTPRPMLTASDVGRFMPHRGPFRFPAPYNTDGIRLTNDSDCAGGTDCVLPVGYSFWRQINNHAGSNRLLVFLGLDRQKGGGGPTLFSYDKLTGQTSNLGSLFDASHPLSWATGEGWYFSATRPHALYVFSGATLQRYDVFTHVFEPVLDAAARFGTNRYIWNVHSSSDDRVHSFTLRDSNSYAMLGCAAYSEATGAYQYFPASGNLDECQIDKSGRYLLIKDNVDGQFGEDNVVIDLQAGQQQVLLDQQGAAGHSDNGFGYLVAEDNFHPLPGAVRVWRLGEPLTQSNQGTLVFHTTSWLFGANHISHANAKGNLPIDQQYACSSSANRNNLALANEVVCYRLDGSLKVLVVAPVMTNLNASGGGSDDYWKYPKGNLDVTGEYFVWTTNMGGGRLDAVMVRVPGHLLVNGTSADTTPPSVAVTSPASGATVAGDVSLGATATDNTGVASVQFLVNGAPVGAADTSAPYTSIWPTSNLASGTYTVSAEARDGSGNVARSADITVSVSTGGGTGGSGGTGGAIPRPVPTPAPVVWTSVVNATVSGAVLQKTGGCAGCPDAGALSTQQIASGDGYLEFTVGDTRLLHFVGLGDANPGTTAGEIRFSLRVHRGRAEVREHGVYRDEVRIRQSDVLRISVVRGQVTYARNGVVFYTSRLGVTYPLTVDTVLYDHNAAVSNAMLAVTTTATTAPEPAPAPTPTPTPVPSPTPVTSGVVWTQLLNTTISGSVLSKTGGCGGCPDAWAVSQQAITADGGYLEFSFPEVSGLRFVGLSVGPATSGDSFVSAIRVQSGRAEVRELGMYRAETVAIAGDVFRIAVQNGVVQYQRNGVVFHQAPASALYPLLSSAVFYDLGTSVSGAVINPGGGSPQP